LRLFGLQSSLTFNSHPLDSLTHSFSSFHTFGSLFGTLWLCFQVENYFRSFMMRKLYENHGEFASYKECQPRRRGQVLSHTHKHTEKYIYLYISLYLHASAIASTPYVRLCVLSLLADQGATVESRSRCCCHAQSHNETATLTIQLPNYTQKKILHSFGKFDCVLKRPLLLEKCTTS